ncbi:MAG: sulfatase-like hydrolase/transferase [Saprospiraceae bacterium]|nr:sulfatase-like hydrolase/transferase [Saprospiraceae bacterium]
MDTLKRFALLFLTMGVFISVSAQTDSTSSKPNIVLILVDDSGLMDFGIYGGEARTPNIDRLTRNGVMFSNMHASPACAPSRAMLMTGSDSHLAGVANLPEMLPEEFQGKPGYAGVLNNRVQTIATRLKEANYNTYTTGKWHLGHDEHTLPTRRGFDRSFILGASGANNFEAQGYLPMKPTAQWYADGSEADVPDDFYSSKTYIDKIISFHEEEINKAQPFFSYVAFQAIHAPIQAPEKFVDPYKLTYAVGWDKLRQSRFEKAKELKFIPQDAVLNDVFPQFRKWVELSKEEQEMYSTDMAVTAGMLEAMDFHIGRYITYLTAEGLMDNTIFIITSDNGPEGADYHKTVMRWAKKQGYHRDFDRYGSKGYYGATGPEFANAMASPFSYFKYYTGEGGLRVPFIMSGRHLPKGVKSDAFCFFTDVAPTIYDIVGLSTMANEGYVPITGKSMLAHITDPNTAIYGDNEGVGLEAGNSSAYFLNGYKIVKNNIPYGDNTWHLYHLRSDPGEINDIASEQAVLFQKMLAEFQNYVKRVGVIQMPKGYHAAKEVGKKSAVAMLKLNSPYLFTIILCIGIFVVWLKKRKVKKLTV